MPQQIKSQVASEQEPVRLKDAKFSELARVPLIELIGAFDRFAMMLFAAALVGTGSGSIALGMATFCALRYIGSKIDQAHADRH